jgi:hypothetical protein
VRQGDPLAAILFILFIDCLHAGFRANPLVPSLQMAAALGYDLLRNVKHAIPSSVTPVNYRIHSLGQADDTGVATQSWEAMCLQHNWMLEFVTAHHMVLNTKKTVCCIASNKLVSASSSPAAVRNGTGPPGTASLSSWSATGAGT